MNELALFAGAGGGVLGGKLLGWNTVGAVEIEKYPREVLLQRQRDGILGKFPIWDDITTFNGRPWKGAVDIISGGFPCQDISAAGKGAGIDGERSGLWGEMARVVREVSPRFVFVENSPMLTSRGLYRVLGDLAEMGYNARWCVLGADDAGAPHRRKRIWIFGYPIKTGLERLSWDEHRGHESRRDEKGQIRSACTSSISLWERDPANLCDTWSNGNEQRNWELREGEQTTRERCNLRRGEEEHEGRERGPIEPELGRVAYGVADRSHRLKAIGNGQVPAVAALAFIILSEGLIII